MNKFNDEKLKADIEALFENDFKGTTILDEVDELISIMEQNSAETEEVRSIEIDSEVSQPEENEHSVIQTFNPEDRHNFEKQRQAEEVKSHDLNESFVAKMFAPGRKNKLREFFSIAPDDQLNKMVDTLVSRGKGTPQIKELDMKKLKAERSYKIEFLNTMIDQMAASDPKILGEMIKLMKDIQKKAFSWAKGVEKTLKESVGVDFKEFMSLSEDIQTQYLEEFGNKYKTPMSDEEKDKVKGKVAGGAVILGLLSIGNAVKDLGVSIASVGSAITSGVFGGASGAGASGVLTGILSSILGFFGGISTVLVISGITYFIYKAAKNKTNEYSEYYSPYMKV